MSASGVKQTLCGTDNQFGRMIQQMAAHERRREDSSAFESIMSKGDAMIKESGLAVGD